MKKIFTILSVIVCCATTNAQRGISFQQLNTTNGLSYLGINDLCTDKKNNLWISTGNGLNMFNGKTVDKYFAVEYPQLQNNNIVHVTCDSSNHIWVLSAGGYVTMLDNARKLHRVSIYRQDTMARTAWILNTPNSGVTLWTGKNFYSYNESTSLKDADSLTAKRFTQFTVKGYDTMGPRGFAQVFHYDKATYLFVRNDAFYKINLQTKEVEKKYTISNCNALIKWGEDELLLSDYITYEVKTINLTTGEIGYPFKNIKDQFDNPVTAYFRFAKKINASEYLFTTFNEGVYIYNSVTGKMYNYKHSLADPASVSNNSQTTLEVASNGWVFIACPEKGVSYFNSADFIGNQNVFLDNKGSGYDGYISAIATDDNNNYYMGNGEGLMLWKRSTNTTTFVNYPGEDGKPMIKKEEVPSVAIDKYGKVWVATISSGIVVTDKALHLLKHLKNIPGNNASLKITRATYVGNGPDGYIWVCGGNGICRIDPQTYAVDNFKNTVLAKLDSFYCGPLLFTDDANVWVATANKGVFHYNIATQNLSVYNTANGLVNNGIFCLNIDRDKNIYIGTRTGLNILFTNGRMKTITQKDGLLIDRAEGLLLDAHNRMWIGNDIGLACYNPADSSLRTFDQRYGLSIFGFRVGSYYQAPNGEFVFGTPGGLQYFYPDSLFNKKITLNASVTKLETKNLVSNITATESFALSPLDNQVTFYFGSVDYSIHLRTYYQYKLEGADKEWINVADQNSVRYNALPPGKYVFKVRVSNDNINWQRAENEVTIIIAAPVYKTWWFKLLSTLLGIAIIIFVINYYRKQQLDKRSRLETELVITYFASQINSHKNTDEMLWDVARNCISKLHFEDCVIYLKDPTKNVLVQKAAYGPKSPVDYKISQPIEIPIGKGITGTVAETGKPEIINNTEHDSRYIVDDDRRFSEIAVPIKINNKVVGVIDSEHKQKNFFTANHLSVLQTIAVLIANQIQKTKAEEDKQKTTIELLENKQKAAESRLQSLRLQMNPHFLFNALNSIQQMILVNEEIVATKYLSRFSKLLRAVLIHSDKESISLKEEMDILKMYVELESVRFKESFTYAITCDEEIETEEIKIPTLLIQPFVENAIWHGLMHKEGSRHLRISFTEKQDFLECTIEDNGVGRKKAQEIKSVTGQDKKHTGKGITVSEERLKALKSSLGQTGTIEITDLEDTAGESAGTRVTINFPIQN